MPWWALTVAGGILAVVLVLPLLEPSPPFPPSPDPLIRRAQAAAEAEFAKHLAGIPRDGAFGVFMSRRESYEEVVSEAGAIVEIGFSPKKFKGNDVKGGGAVFHIRKVDGRMLDHAYSK
jgi:hypothetical protein